MGSTASAEALGASAGTTTLAEGWSSEDVDALEARVLEPDEIAAGVRLVLDDDGSLSVEDGFVAMESPTGTVYRWRCAVCGYIHEAPSPPRWCPLCGADQSQFENIGEVVA